jgi:hypothetical protein
MYFCFVLCIFCVVLCVFVLFYVLLFYSVYCLFCVVLCIFVLFFVFFCCFLYCLFCVVLCVLFVCICVLYYCHRVATQLQLNISYHVSHHIIFWMSVCSLRCTACKAHSPCCIIMCGLCGCTEYKRPDFRGNSRWTENACFYIVNRFSVKHFSFWADVNEILW